MTVDLAMLVAIGLLSLAAGGMDGLSFLALGHIFASAMSGNIVLLGLALSGGGALRPLAALSGYIAGVALTTALLRRVPRLALALGVEALLLAAFTAVWALRGPAEAAYALIALGSLAMGVQGAAAARLRMPGIITVVFTSALTDIIRVLTGLAEGKPLTGHARHQIAMLICYFAGALGIGLLRSYGGFALPLVAVLLASLAASRTKVPR